MNIWLYIIGISIGELVTSFVSPQGGIVIHIVLLLLLLIHSLIESEHPIHQVYLTLTIAPLIRIISLSMPLYPFPQLYWYLITSIPLFVGVISITRILGYRAKDIGLTMKGIVIQILTGITGIGFGYIEYLILHPKPLIEHISLNSIFIPALILIFSTGFAEELAFRGMMQKAFYEVMNKYGILAVSIVFASLHIGHLSLIDVIFVFGVAIFFSIIVLKTKSIIGVALAHGITNVTLYLIWPFIL